MVLLSGMVAKSSVFVTSSFGFCPCMGAAAVSLIKINVKLGSILE